MRRGGSFGCSPAMKNCLVVCVGVRVPLLALLYSSACTTVLSLPLMLSWQSVIRLQIDQNTVTL